MDIKTILTKVAAGKATLKVAGEMLEVKIKQWNADTGTLGNPLKEYLSIKKLQLQSSKFAERAADIKALLTEVGL